jgi:hypothetical protein
VKHNFFALHGRSFRDLEDLNQKLESWTLEVADERIHGTTHEKPSERFKGEQLAAPEGTAPYRIETDMTRIVPRDAQVVYKTNRYSVPWKYAGREALLYEQGERLLIYVAGELTANHPLLSGRYEQHLIAGHFEGILKSLKPRMEAPALVCVSLWHTDAMEEVQVRDLASYDALAGLSADRAARGGAR